MGAVGLRVPADLAREIAVLAAADGKSMSDEGVMLLRRAVAARLGISKQHLCDIEKERKTVSAARAAEWARELGQVEAVFVELALRSLLREAGLAYDIQLVPTPRKDGRRPKKRAV